MRSSATGRAQAAALALALGMLAAGGAASGCSDDPAPSSPVGALDGGAPADAGAAPCAEGFRPLPDGIGCDVVLPSGDCPAGTRARIGAEVCAKLATATCPSFMRFDAGRGVCVDAAPRSACAGATREAAFQGTCAPVGDCAAAFPPPAATVFVDAAFAPGQLDATHVRTIGEALAVAAPGATVAIESGAYEESLAPTKAVTLAGRCASSVRLVAPAGATSPGLAARGVAVTARGLTIEGHVVGAIAEAKGSLTLEGVVLDKNRDMGLAADGAGSTVSLTQGVVRATTPAVANVRGWGVSVDRGAKATLTDASIVDAREIGVAVAGDGSSVSGVRVVVSRVTPSLATAHAVDALAQGSLELTDSVVAGNVGQGVSVDQGATAKLVRVVVRDTVEDASGSGGHGVEAQGGSKLVLEDSVLSDNREVALGAIGKGTLVEVRRTAVVDTRPSAKGGFGVGVGAQRGARLVFDDGLVARAYYYGFFAVDRGTTVEITRSLVTDVKKIDQLGRGLDVQQGGLMVARDSTVQRCATDGVVTDGQGGEATFEADHLLVRRTSSAGVFGRQGGRAKLVASAVVEASDVGVYTSNTESPEGHRCDFTLESCVIKDTQPAADGANGAGLVSGGVVHASKTTLAGNRGYAVASAGEGGVMELTQSVLRGSIPEKNGGLYGHGLIGLDRASLRISDCDVLDNARVGLAFQNVRAVIERSRIVKNEVGLHVQGDSQLAEVSGAPEAAGPNQVLVTTDTRFEGNQQKLGSGFVPLPNVKIAK